MLKRIWVYNQSEILSDRQVRLMTKACDIQLREHFAPSWGIRPVPVRFMGTMKSGLGVDEAIVSVLDKPSRDARKRDLLGTRYVQDRRAFGSVFVKQALESRDPKDFDSYVPTISTTLSHEILELLANPSITEWVDGPMLRGCYSYRKEVCDPVSFTKYEVKVRAHSVSVSNFVLPAWFGISTEEPKFDHLGLLTKPFTLSPGGYLTIRNASDEMEIVKTK